MAKFSPLLPCRPSSNQFMIKTKAKKYFQMTLKLRPNLWVILEEVEINPR